MNQKSTIIAAVVVVAIVVIAGVVVLTNNNNNKNPDSPIASQLQIRGNANDDYTIDNQDMQIVDNIIAGTATLADHPLADVNNDGVVDQTDKTLLQDLIDRKEGTTVYVLCLDTAGNNVTVQCTYPLRNIVTYATNMQLPVLYANGGQYIAGYFSSSYDVAESSISSTAVDLGGSSRSISDAAWQNFTNLDTTVEGGVKALLTDYSAVAQFTEARRADLSAAGIPLIIWPSANATDEITTVLTLGFLFGGDCETLGMNYATASWNAYNAIQDYAKSLSNDQKVSYICLTMWTYICQNDSTYNTSPGEAGGVPYYTVNSEFAAAYAGSGSSRMTSVEAMSNYPSVGVVISNRSMDFGVTDMSAEIVEAYEHVSSSHQVKEYFSGIEDKLVYVNNILPGAAKLAYMAHALYGDQFSLDWANGILQQFIDMGVAPLSGQTLSTIPAYIDYAMYQGATASA